METEPVGYVSVPMVDLDHYLPSITGFFTNFSTKYGITLWLIAKGLVGFVIAIAIPVSFFFIIAIIITMESLKKVRAREDEMFNQPPAQAKKEEKANAEQAKRWRKVVEHADSPNQNDWKQAIMEADVMLEQLVTSLGYKGESVGEKLKRASKGDFKSLDQAWEAHKVRNRIAHDGSAFDINQFEAKRVIGLYRQVFDEFYHISS